MIANLKLINPFKENELFSIHNNKKKILSENSSNSYFNNIYKTFQEQKYSFTSLKKPKKFVSTLSDINKKKSKIINMKNNIQSNIPYPSFSNNKKIPGIYRNLYKTVKYPKINNNYLTLNNYNRFNNINKKIILLKNNSNSRIKTDNYIDEQNKKSTKYKTFNVEKSNKILNHFLTNTNIFRNKNNIKYKLFNEEYNKNNNNNNDNDNDNNENKNYNKKIKNEKKPNLKVNNFNNIISNIFHTIDVRDQHNNNLLYTKVTNLLMDEIDKLLFLQPKRNRFKKSKIVAKFKKTSKYKKIKMIKRNLSLSEDSNISFNKRRIERIKSLKTSANLNINFFRKYGFGINNEVHIRKRYILTSRNSEQSLLSKDTSYDNLTNLNDNDNIKNNKQKKYKDSFNQTIESSFNNTKRQNYFLGNVKQENKNKQDLNDNSTNNNIIKNNKKFNIFNFNNNQTTNNIFNNLIKEREKRNDKNININKKEEKINFSSFLDSIVTKIHLNSNKYKDENNNNNTNNDNNSIPIFEQIVRNDRLIKLIHEFIMIKREYPEVNEENNEYKKKKSIDDFEKNEEIEENENKEKQNIRKEKDEDFWEYEEQKEEKKKQMERKKKEQGDIEVYISKNENEEIFEDKEIKEMDEEIKKIKQLKRVKKHKKEDKKGKKGKKGKKKLNEGEKDKNEYNDVVVKNKVDNEEIKKNKIPQVYTLKKIELGLEIVKHLCDEIQISKDMKINLIKNLTNLMYISKKENKTKPETMFHKNIMIPVNDIIREYLKNMNKINLSNKKPKYLLSNSLKLFLKRKLKEISEFNIEDYYYEEEEEEEDIKETKKKKIILEDKKKYQKNKEKKELIYDNSYFFNKKKNKQKLDNVKSKLIASLKTEENNNNNINKESNLGDNSFGGSTLYNNNDNKYKINFVKKNFVKIKNAIGLKRIFDDIPKVVIEKKSFSIDEEENEVDKEDILDKKLNIFFEHIRNLKNLKKIKDEERLRIYLDKELEKFDYAQQRKMEERKYNFFNDLRLTRKTLQTYYNKKIHYHSPLIFNTFKNNE